MLAMFEQHASNALRADLARFATGSPRSSPSATRSTRWCAPGKSIRTGGVRHGHRARNLEVVAGTLAELFQPLEERLEAGEVLFLLAELGLQFPDALATNAGFANAAKAVGLRAKDMVRLAGELTAAVEAVDVGQIVSKGLALANAIKGVIEESEKVGTALKTAGAGAGIPAVELNAFASECRGG